MSDNERVNAQGVRRIFRDIDERVAGASADEVIAFAQRQSDEHQRQYDARDAHDAAERASLQAEMQSEYARRATLDNARMEAFTLLRQAGGTGVTAAQLARQFGIGQDAATDILDGYAADSLYQVARRGDRYMIQI
jgi:hypothetical protein